MHREFWYGFSLTVVFTVVVRVLLTAFFMAILVSPIVWAVRKYGWKRGLFWGVLGCMALQMVFMILDNITSGPQERERQADEINRERCQRGDTRYCGLTSGADSSSAP
jgi:hypothetical protein